MAGEITNIAELRKAIDGMRALDAGFDEELSGYNDGIDDALRKIGEFEANVRGRLEQLERKAEWKELFYPDGQSRGKFAASPWTHNIYPWLKEQLEQVLADG